MSMQLPRKHLFISRTGISSRCEVCGEIYGHEIHKEALGPNSLDLHHMSEDDRIDLVAKQVREGKRVGILLEAGIGKIERYLQKIAEKYPDVRLYGRQIQSLGQDLKPKIEIITFGPELWCVHIQGPDDLHAAPSKDEADRAVAFRKEKWKETASPEEFPHVDFTVARWPHTFQRHAQSVEFFYGETGLPRPGIEEKKPFEPRY